MHSPLPCAVIRDLLPAYQEGLLGEETHGLVEEHLAQCDACHKEAAALAAALPETLSPGADQSLAAVKKTYRSIRLRTLGIALVVAVMLFLMLVFGLDAMQRMQIHLAPEEMDQTALYVGEEGKVYYTNGTSHFALRSFYSRLDPYTDTGILTISMLRPPWPFSRRLSPEDAVQDYGVTSLSDLLDATLIDGRLYIRSYQEGPDSYEVQSQEMMEIRMGNEKDGYITLWQTGDSLPSLPEGVEILQGRPEPSLYGQWPRPLTP